MFVDVRLEGMPKAVKTEEREKRYLKVSNKKNRDRYLQYVESCFEGREIYERIEQMEEKERRKIPDTVIEDLLNEIDGEIQGILMEGEKRLAPSRKD